MTAPRRAIERAATAERRSRRAPPREAACSVCRRSTSAGSPISGATSAAIGRSGFFIVLFVLSLFAEFIANDRPLVAFYKGEIAVSRSSTIIRKTKFGGFLADTDYRDPFIAERDRGAWLDDLAADPLFLRTIDAPADAGARRRRPGC